MNTYIVVNMLLVIGIAIWCFYDYIVAIYRKTLRYETFLDNAKVCNKSYVSKYTTFILIDGQFIPQYYNEEYNVYIMYEDKEYFFNDKYLSDRVNVGDSVTVLVHKGYNKKNELKHVYISIDN